MSAPVVRRLLVDLETPFARRWNGGDAFRTALFNALSMSFPVGEQFFIDSVRQGLARLEGEQRERFAAEVQGFVGQEATHRRVHSLFNRQLEQQGFVNHWEPRSRERLKLLEGKDVRGWLGVTAATEHFTAIFAEHLLTTPAVLEGAEPRVQTLWLWHASEESEHRSTAFDLYRALGGNEEWRIRLYRTVTWHFATDLARQTVNNLWHDGALFRPSTWASAWRTLFARGGMVRAIARPWRQYLQPGFHPSQGDTVPGERWLASHADVAPAVAAEARPAAAATG